MVSLINMYLVSWLVFLYLDNMCFYWRISLSGFDVIGVKGILDGVIVYKSIRYLGRS